MAARLQAATTSGHPILLRVREVGHNPQMSPAQMMERGGRRAGVLRKGAGTAGLIRRHPRQASGRLFDRSRSASKVQATELLP